ncbi:MAG: hypothetical protein GWO08_03300 [Gammaproteobacteria bacterium]|nr:hypothetical protein [Gammaproteobacteria bacterium]NIW46509.1 hypothetical protein [Gammaproteobacteria bacterium]NIX57548.1 hypothetical protein [candidate division Zixibacteria bacterium]
MKKTIGILIAIGLVALLTIPALAGGVNPARLQGFEHNTDGWFGSETPGVLGWCGTITRMTRGNGPVDPSAGSGYAVLENGNCNDFWASIFPTSAPYGIHEGAYTDSWPHTGYVAEIDVYLDPSWGAGAGFNLFASTQYLDGFRYFLMPVSVVGDMVMVSGHGVGEAGWYTFRTRFQDEGGYLAVDFELVNNGKVLYSMPLETTVFSVVPTSSLAVSDSAPGYFWFDSISEGLQLPVDQHMFRPGQ